MSLKPRKNLTDDFVSELSCAICGSPDLHVSHIETYPDFVACDNCGSAFVVEDGGSWIMYGKIPPEYSETREFALKQWTWLDAVAQHAAKERERIEAERVEEEPPPPVVEEEPPPPVAEEEVPEQIEPHVPPFYEETPDTEVVTEEVAQVSPFADSVAAEDLEATDVSSEEVVFEPEPTEEIFPSETTVEPIWEPEPAPETLEEIPPSESAVESIWGAEPDSEHVDEFPAVTPVESIWELEPLEEGDEPPGAEMPEAVEPVEEVAIETDLDLEFPEEPVEAEAFPEITELKSEVEDEPIDLTDFEDAAVVIPPTAEEPVAAEPGVVEEPQPVIEELAEPSGPPPEEPEREPPKAAVGEPEPDKRYRVVVQGSKLKFPKNICAHCLSTPVKLIPTTQGTLPDPDQPAKRRDKTFEVPLCTECRKRAEARTEEENSARLIAYLVSGVSALILIVVTILTNIVNLAEDPITSIVILLALAILGFGIPATILISRSKRYPPPRDAAYVLTTLIVSSAGENLTAFEWRNRGYAELFRQVNRQSTVDGVTLIKDHIVLSDLPEPRQQEDEESLEEIVEEIEEPSVVESLLQEESPPDDQQVTPE
ncbi:MAG: hypothetical protein GTO18_21305 [Anaerolineales bacterium]|nr:hypothetical protein [Anaerolineales bacterium]